MSSKVLLIIFQFIKAGDLRHVKRSCFEDYWSISASELGIIKKYRGVNRLKCAALLKYYQVEGRFPEKYSNIYDLGCKKLAVILDIFNDIDLALTI